MIRLAIVEDDRQFQIQLQDYVQRYAAQSERAFDITTFNDGAEIVEADQPRFDVILMDIQMRNMDGMTAAHRIRETDDNAVIVFITNMAQFAIEGYSVDALDYLLKPLTYYAFSQCMDRVISRVTRRKKTYLFISNQHGGFRVDSADLLFVEVHGHQLLYHTANGDYEDAGSMKEVEQTLSGLPFFRCNKCDLVNLVHVDGIRDGDAMVGSYRVQVSRAKKKPFMEALNRYLNEVHG